MTADIIFALVSFLASVIGCICGIGGGVIIKPVLDSFEIYPVNTVSFMSGCIVLSMTAYSVLKARLAGELELGKGESTWLAIGAAIGGVAGKQLFNIVKAASANPDRVGAVQAAALFIITFATMIYTARKSKIKTINVESNLLCCVMGLALGIMSSFLGIGGGPINLVVLSYFFSMETKRASQNSLYIILISQLTSLAFTIITNSVPNFPVALFVVMVLCGIAGGAVGRKINRRIDGKTVEKLFIGLLCVIMVICCYNFGKYSF